MKNENRHLKKLISRGTLISSLKPSNVQYPSQYENNFRYGIPDCTFNIASFYFLTYM